MTAKHNESRRLVREAKREWVPLKLMRVPPAGKGQRPINEAFADKLAAEFDPEVIGRPIVSKRDGVFYILDGQKRIYAYKKWIGDGWESQQLECDVYTDLTPAEEADKFLKHNTALAVSKFWMFTNAVTAGHSAEVECEEVVRSLGLKIARGNVPGAISAVAALLKVYNRSGADTLRRSLQIIRDAYGDVGFESAVIDGIGHLCQRYNGMLDDSAAIAKLGDAHGGINGLLAKAELLRKQTGNYRSHCVAAAAVDIINSTRGGKKLPSWWKLTAEELVEA